MIHSLNSDGNDWVVELRALLSDLHREAVAAHIQLEVFTGELDAAFLSEFEHALSHVVKQILQGHPSSELPHVRSHLQRIVVEAYEFIAEECLASIRDRLDPFRRHPRLARYLLLDRPKRLDEFYGGVRVIQLLIIDGRENKGHDGSYEQARDSFKKAARLAAELDSEVPSSRFRDRLFSICLATISLILGITLTLIFT